MNLQTQIPLQKQSHHQIDYNSKLLLLGSCFSENIGNKLGYFKFQSTQNPFGILFQPKAIEQLITNSINEKEYTEVDIFNHNEIWSCFDAHSALSSINKNELLEGLNSAIKATHQQLKNTSHIIITLGTSWVYRFIETDILVANCHKIPQKKFLKEILSVDEITESLTSTIALIRSINTNASIILTVSPVRHIKDGFIENQQSKAHLLSAIHQVVEPRKNVHYFPSYEIMMDELRDYRFYADDMIHPSEVAINYIWEKFTEAWLSDTSKEIMKEVDTIQKGLAHRPFNPNTEQHQQFLKNLQQKKETLQQAFPFIQF
ncbi:GSCFA domain-containing protein [Tenacibaculum sp. IB213877]|uniref:GSCFA domain-containing protein n=1 Tax=Tenacibaculum sp. IB213877 TaxID=3097351 RepID=UPI002A59D850|nr:GSCFA domain-containing protein [Tenacibaculum sp. IB213877]MDY0780907.1 GSCFA domain-containing protein [Tenacibaculum sp. IB213877]